MPLDSRSDPPHEAAQTTRVRNRIGRAACLALALLWHAVRLPILGCLIVLEPIVRTVLCVLAVVLLFCAFFLEFAADLPGFPFWGMLATAAACMLALMAYYLVLRLLS